MPPLRIVGQSSIGNELRRAPDSKSRSRHFRANGVRIMHHLLPVRSAQEDEDW
jgi:hypothetical protein